MVMLGSASELFGTQQRQQQICGKAEGDEKGDEQHGALKAG
jgi:hypothetical protein